MKRARTGKAPLTFGFPARRSEGDMVRQENDQMNMMMCMRYCIGRGGLFM